VHASIRYFVRWELEQSAGFSICLQLAHTASYKENSEYRYAISYSRNYSRGNPMNGSSIIID
jgi:hypothetical protein